MTSERAPLMPSAVRTAPTAGFVVDEGDMASLSV